MPKGIGRISKLELLAVVCAVSAVYFLTLPGADRPAFMGAFNNLDGSLYAARAVSAAAGIAVFFIVAIFAFPSRLTPRRVLFFLAAGLAAIAGASILEAAFQMGIKGLFALPMGADAFSDKQLAFPLHVRINPAVLPRNALAAGLAALYGLGRDWLMKSRNARRLEAEKMKAEIALLKSQVNPHYFFNALNNIFAVTQRNDDEEAGRAILKLSETMRYMIYDGEAETICAGREVEHIRNTIEVFRLRFAPEDDPEIRLRTDGDLDSFPVAPSLLAPFVENALKHGLDSAGRGKVDIDIRRDGDWLEMRVENTRRAGAMTMPKPGGIGLANVRKRLELLYPRRHELDVEETDEMHRIRLRLKQGGENR